MINKLNPIFLLLILLQFFILTHIKYTVWPEMILYPFLINHGFKLYQNIINPYFPFLPLFLTVFFKLLGESVLSLKILTYLIILTYDFVMLFLINKFSDDKIKNLGIFTYFILIQTSFGGNSLWFELFLAPFLLFALGLFYFGKTKRDILIASILITLSILIKQNSILFLIPVLLIFIQKKQWNNIVILITISIITFAPFLIYIIYLGVFNDFLNWTIKLPTIMSGVPGFVLLPTQRQYLLISALLLPVFFISKFKFKYYWVLAAIISAMFAFPRFEDFHLQVLVGLSAILLVFIPKRWIVFFILVSLILSARTIIKNWNQPDRFIDQDLSKTVELIKPLNSVYLLSSPEMAYFFTNKLPPKIWATNFPWYFINRDFEDKFVDNLKTQKIEYIVMGKRTGGDTYTLGNYIPPKVLDYLNKSYILKQQKDGLELWQRK